MDHTNCCGMNPADMPMSGALPEWLLVLFSIWFIAGTLFYLYRLFHSELLRAVDGYFDVQNELSHLWCMPPMVTMLTPQLLPVPSAIWAYLLGFGTIFFLFRAGTWGRKLPYNRILWDLIHAGMLGFMALMFTHFHSPLLTWVSAAFWVFFTGYAASWSYKARKEGRNRGWLGLGSDLAHITMGIVMFFMTVFPHAFMPGMMMNMPM